MYFFQNFSKFLKFLTNVLKKKIFSRSIINKKSLLRLVKIRLMNSEMGPRAHAHTHALAHIHMDLF